MKITVFMPKIYGGTGLYRCRMPHDTLGFDVEYTDIPKIEFLNGDIVFASKMYFTPILPLLPTLKTMGIKLIVDYDDYWSLPQDHLLYEAYKAQNTSKLLADSLRLFDYVTCTTELLANEIRPINKNVVVFENAVDMTLDQFKLAPIEDENYRFGWVGGHCHLPDIKLLEGTPERLTTEFDKYRINLFGHDNQANSIYNEFAKVLSGYGKANDKLNVYSQAPVEKYTIFYNLIDCCLIPLVNNKFNTMKSELKLVEGAIFKKPCIVSDTMPYKKHMTDKNSLSVTNKTDWYKHMRRLLKNKNMGIDLGNQLFMDLKDKFDIKNVNKRRKEFYESIV